MSVTYDANWLYSFSTLGQKITWMRANPHVCVEVEELVSAQDWATVIVIGRYQELTTEKERTYAHDLLERRPAWWEPGYSRTVIEGKERPLKPVYFRILIDQITGHLAIPRRIRGRVRGLRRVTPKAAGARQSQLARLIEPRFSLVAGVDISTAFRRRG
jgi:hypothetical protein